MSQQEQILILSWLLPMLNGNQSTSVGIFPVKYRDFVITTALLNDYVPLLGYPTRGFVQVTFVKLPSPC